MIEKQRREARRQDYRRLNTLASQKSPIERLAGIARPQKPPIRNAPSNLVRYRYPSVSILFRRTLKNLRRLRDSLDVNLLFA